MDQLDSLPRRLAHARELAGLSQRALSALAGLDPTHVRLLEDGKRQDLYASTALALVKVLGVDIEWLLTGEGKAPSERAVRAAVERARGNRTGTEG